MITVVALGLLSAAFYGAADFLGGFATKRMPAVAVTTVSQTVGFIVLACVVHFFGGAMSATHIAWTIAAGVVGGAGIALLYRALAIGKMGVVSPITAVLAAALPVLIGVVRGDPLQWFQLAGVGIALVAVVLIARSKESPGMREFSTAGVKEAIASGILLGILFLALGTSGPGSGLEALLFARIGSLGLLVVASFVTGASLRPTRETVGPVVWSGAIDMTANIFFVIAAQSGALAVSAVLASLYPGSTVLLARFVLRERLAIVQKAGVALALAGVVLIAA